MNEAPPIVAVTGAGGGIGRRLLPILLEEFHVRALYRREGDASRAAAGIGAEPVFGRLEDDASLERLVEGATAVVHCAASVVHELRSAHRTNVEGTHRLAMRAARAGCRRFVHLSTISVYLGNESSDGIYTEDLPLAENWQMDRYSRTKLGAETALRKAAESTSMETVILRPTCVYGPAIESWTTLPLRVIGRGLPLMLGDGDGEVDAVHVDDVVQAIRLAIDHTAAAGQAFNLGGQTLPTREFLGYFARMAGRPLRRIRRKTVDAILALGGAIERRHEVKLLVNASPNRLRLVDFVTSGRPGHPKFPSTKLRERLGYAPAVSLSGGMLGTQFWAEREGLLQRRRTFRHGEHNYSFRPALTVSPETEADLEHIVREAKRQNRRVRAIGSIHSFAPLAATDAIGVAPERLNRAIAIEGNRVTVQAGMRLSELTDYLASHGLALPVVGGVRFQTISGAISTGTHGGSLHHGSLADAVEAVRLVPGDGRVLALDRSDERFFGAVLSLGLCGILSEVSLRCVPAFWLRSEVRTMPFEELLARFDALQQEGEYCEASWSPLADVVEVMTTRRLRDAVADRELKPGFCPGANWMTRPFAKLGWRQFDAGRWRRAHRWVARRWAGTWYPSREGRSDYVLAYHGYKPSGVPLAELNLAVPVERTRDALTALRDHFVQSDRYPLLAVRARCQRSERFWLSGSNGRDVTWIELYHSLPADDFARTMHELFVPFDYRPHWGKVLHPDPAWWGRAYPRYAEFQELRRQLDPGGMFANDYVTRIGLVPQSESSFLARID